MSSRERGWTGRTGGGCSKGVSGGMIGKLFWKSESHIADLWKEALFIH